MTTVLMTGAAGGVGGILRPRLARPGRTLRLLDLAEITPGEGEEFIQGSVTDPDIMLEACQGADAVIHLGGISVEAPWDRILDVNINGTYTVFEAARRAGVPRVVFASSNHAVGFYRPEEFPIQEDVTALPDTYYGVSKVAGEALGALYAKRYGMDVISVRILSCFPEPQALRSLSTWLSPEDGGRLFEACLTVEKPGYRVVYGVSDNTRGGWVSLEGARALGYESHDDSEAYHDKLVDRFGPIDPADFAFKYLGGPFCSPDLDADHL
ncbi:MAG TPA: NAD(P)-dependent oxidoreductase [Actinospica sp.]|nr:NAD(P)-dependent oxidoreductase [Actinospica sp.]